MDQPIHALVPEEHRAALHGLGLQPQRQLTGLVVALDLDLALGVAVHDGLEPAMLGTALAEEDLSGAADHLSLEYLPADGTDRPGLLQENGVVRRALGRGFHVAV